MNNTDKIYGGAFHLARQIFSSKIWLEKPSTWKIIWIYILGKVNHKKNGKFDRGEGFFNFSQELRLIGNDITYNMIRHSMGYFRKSGMISTRRSTRGMIIKVLKYNTYQTLSNFESTKKSTSRAQEKHKRSTPINKNVKNDKNDKNVVMTTLLIKKLMNWDNHQSTPRGYKLKDWQNIVNKYSAKKVQQALDEHGQDYKDGYKHFWEKLTN